MTTTLTTLQTDGARIRGKDAAGREYTLNAALTGLAQATRVIEKIRAAGMVINPELWTVRAPAATAAPALGDFARMVELFRKAGAHLRFPFILIDAGSAGTLRLSVAGAKAREPGTINVTTEGSFEDRTWFGRIALDGRFMASATTRQSPHLGAIMGALRAFATDPAKVAAAYGRRTGHCCFCKRELTDGRSVAVGYGPICAGHYDLPWGDVTVGAEEIPMEEIAPAPAPAPVDTSIADAMARHLEPRRPAVAESAKPAMDWERGDDLDELFATA